MPLEFYERIRKKVGFDDSKLYSSDPKNWNIHWAIIASASVSLSIFAVIILILV